MQEKYLILNESSKKLKFSLYELPNKEINNIVFEKTVNSDNNQVFRYKTNKFYKDIFLSSYEKVINYVIKILTMNGYIKNIDEIKGIGIKVLNGGKTHSESEELNEDLINSLKRLENNNILNSIECIKNIFKNSTNIAVFDTSFHNTIPEHNLVFNKNKYDTHGLCHRYISEFMKKISARNDINIINCYIGSEASICSIKDGMSINISKNITPLDCLVMGKKSSSLNPKIIEFISDFKNITLEETIRIINTENGLKYIFNEEDLKKLIEMSKKGNPIAKLALDNFIIFITKTIYNNFIILNGEINAITITGETGVNSNEIRKMILDKLSNTFDICLDEEENNKIGKYKEKQIGAITKNNSQLQVFVIPNNEETIILDELYKVVKNNMTVKKLILNQ